MRSIHKRGIHKRGIHTYGWLGAAAILLIISGCASLAESPATVAALASQDGAATDESTKEVRPGVTLTWTSSFLFEDVPARGGYAFTVTVSSAAGSARTVTIDRLDLVRTSPRPRGQAPAATGAASGLPITVAPGESASFTVSGSYELAATDEGGKANLHFRGRGQSSGGDPFNLGINAHFRAPGAEEGDNGSPAGPPPEVGRPAGPPPGGPPPGRPGRP
jgi:hypothetical protein